MTSRHWLGKRRSLLPAVGGVILTGVLIGAQSSAAQAGPPPTLAGAAATAAGASPLLEGAAEDQARRTGRDVEVGALTTDRTRTVAHPDGTFTLTTNARPVRVKEGDRWVPVDNTLIRSADGSVRPRAAALDMTFSGGGAGPMAVLGEAGHRLSFSWGAAQLPRPVLDGAAATYPEVLPGVDLVVTADIDTFTEVLVVKTRKASTNPKLRNIAFTVDAPGLKVRKQANGTVQAVDKAGAVAFTSPSPQMWDSRSAKAPAGSAPPVTGPAKASDRTAQPGVGARVKHMTSSLTKTTLTVRPDASLLDDPATQYPVQIDPSWSSKRLAWAYVDKKFPSVSYYNTSNDANVGYESEVGTTKRSFFRLDVSGVRGKTILDTSLRMVETWAWSCTAREMQVWATSGIGSTTTWNNQPSWLYKVTSKTFAYNWHPSAQASPCPNPSGGVEFDVDKPLTDAAKNKYTSITLGIRAASETDTFAFKRFNNNPSLSITYDTPPTAPASATTQPATACTGGTIGATDISLRAVPQDGDGGTVTARFEYWPSGGAKLTKDVAATAGQPATLALKRTLTAGLWYWRVQTISKNSLGTSVASPFTTQCSFTVDLSAPAAHVTVTSPSFTDYSDNLAGAVTGLAGRVSLFTFTTAPDVASVRVGFDQTPPTYSAKVTNGSVTLGLMPTTTGPLVLNVQTFDAAGNTSGIDSDFDIFALAPPQPAALAANDMNSDGNPDVLRVMTDDKVCLYPGAGALATATTSAFSGGGNCSFVTSPGASTTYAGKPAALGNWDGDPEAPTNDVLLLTANGKLQYCDGNGVGGFARACTTITSNQMDADLNYPDFNAAFVQVYGAGDWDGDGDSEIAGKAADGKLYLVMNDDGRAGTPAGSPLGYLLGTGWTSFEVSFPGDLNDDGQVDAMGRYLPSGSMYAYIGDPVAKNKFLPTASGGKVFVGGGWEVYDQTFALGDWNRDGYADLGARGTDGVLWMYAGTRGASPYLATRVSAGTGWFSNWLM